MGFVLRLCAWCLLVTLTLSQTRITVAKTGKMTIHRVIDTGGTAIIDLDVLSDQKGGVFKWMKSGGVDVLHDLGKYKNEKDGTLSFSKKESLALYTLEQLLINGHIQYEGNILRPTFSYMISAHGGEYRNPLNRAQDTRQVWARLSTLYFFSPQHSVIDATLGEGYTKEFEAGNFEKLKSISASNGENVANAGTVNHHFASYGGEFDVSSGIYSMVRANGKWWPVQIATIPPADNQGLVRLFDVVAYLEANYGPGDVYWNACREDKTTGIFPENLLARAVVPVLPLVNVRDYKKLKTWRTEVVEKCVKDWLKEQKTTQEKCDEYMNERIKLWLEDEDIVDDAPSLVKAKRYAVELKSTLTKLQSDTKSERRPVFSASNCLKASEPLKLKRMEMVAGWNTFADKCRGLVVALQPPALPGGFFPFRFGAHEEYQNMDMNNDDVVDELQEMREMLSMLQDIQKQRKRRSHYRLVN